MVLGATMKKIKIDHINLLHLKGTKEEMAFQHGSLLKEEIQNSALQKLASKNQFVISEAKGVFGIKWIQKSVVNIYEKILVPLLVKSLPKDENKVLDNIAKGAGISKTMLLQACYQADGLMILSRLSMMKYLFWKFPKRDLPGCSSAVVAKELTKNNKMLVMRNQDYPIVGPWEKNTLVAFCEPTEKDLHPYMFVSSAGLHTSGLTSMNIHGLTVAAHAHFGKDVSSKNN